MILLADLIDRYSSDLEQRHGQQLLPGHHRALQAMRFCRNQHSRVMVLECNGCHHQVNLPILAVTAAAPTVSTTKASNGWSGRRPNSWLSTIS